MGKQLANIDRQKSRLMAPKCRRLRKKQLVWRSSRLVSQVERLATNDVFCSVKYSDNWTEGKTLDKKTWCKLKLHIRGRFKLMRQWRIHVRSRRWKCSIVLALASKSHCRWSVPCRNSNHLDQETVGSIYRSIELGYESRETWLQGERIQYQKKKNLQWRDWFTISAPGAPAWRSSTTNSGNHFSLSSLSLPVYWPPFFFLSLVLVMLLLVLLLLLSTNILRERKPKKISLGTRRGVSRLPIRLLKAPRR